LPADACTFHLETRNRKLESGNWKIENRQSKIVNRKSQIENHLPHLLPIRYSLLPPLSCAIGNPSTDGQWNQVCAAVGVLHAQSTIEGQKFDDKLFILNNLAISIGNRQSKIGNGLIAVLCHLHAPSYTNGINKIEA